MNLEKNRHSLAHIMAHAVKNLYPEALFGMGPAIENGFYYDFDNVKISDEDFKKIEEKMRELIKQNIPFEKETIGKKEAEKLFKDEPYKMELLRDIEGEEVTIYKSGDFVDLCSGPHVENSKEISPDSFKLDRTAGAYFKGSEENKMLQRIYGLAFETKEELTDYLEKREEAERRDHRKIGKRSIFLCLMKKLGRDSPFIFQKEECFVTC